MHNKLHDGLNFLSKLSLARLCNAGQLIGSYYLSKWTGQARHSGWPMSLAFEPTTACNLRCPECPSGLRSFTRPTGVLPDDLFKKVMDELASRLLYLTFYFQGEPYLHPRFLELVAYAAQKNIYTATSTNGHYLHDHHARKTVESGLDRLIISIDGTTQETYQQYRVGGKLAKVLEGTRNVIAWKKRLRSRTPHVVFQFLVVRPNEHQIAEVKQLARSLGVDAVVLKTAQIYDYQHGSPLIPEQTQYARYRRLPDGSYTIKNRLLNHCWKMWHACVVTWDGQVVPCCFDKDAQHTQGHLSHHTFAQVWNSEAYRHFRQQVLTSRSRVEMCRNCTEGTQVWA